MTYRDQNAALTLAVCLTCETWVNQASTITGASPALLSGLVKLYDFGGFGSVAPHLSECFPAAFDFDPCEMIGPGTRYANMEAFLAIPAKPAPQA